MFFHRPGWCRPVAKSHIFFLFFLILQGTSIGLARTNHALLSLVATKLMQYTCTCASHQRSCTDLHHAFFSIELILFEKKFIKGNINIYGSQKIVVLTYNQGLVLPSSASTQLKLRLSVSLISTLIQPPTHPPTHPPPTRNRR